MPYRVYDITFVPTVGSLGTLVEYKESTESDWITPNVPANPTTLTTYPLTLELGKTYNVRVSSFSANCTSKYKYLLIYVPVSGHCCPDGYTLSPDETFCFKESETAPTIVTSDICLAASQLATQYSSSGTNIYDPGYTIRLVGSSTNVTTQPQWREQSGQVLGPMNREGVWVDTNCDGTKDPLTAGQVLKITYVLSLSVPATMFIGIGGDNTFKVEVNGTAIVDCDTSNPAGGGPSANNFNFWHVFPVNFESGDNYITFSAVGDGSTNDAFSAVLYNNTAGQLAAATADNQLNIVFKTSTYRGTHIDIATCPSGYFLDTTGGQGSYVCRKVETTESTEC